MSLRNILNPDTNCVSLDFTDPTVVALIPEVSVLQGDVTGLINNSLQLSGNPAEYTGLPSTAMTIHGIITGDTISSTGGMYASGTVNTAGLNIIKQDETGYYNTFANATGITIDANLTTTNDLIVGRNITNTGVVNSQCVQDAPTLNDYSINSLDFSNITTNVVNLTTASISTTINNGMSGSGQYTLIACKDRCYSSNNYGASYTVEAAGSLSLNTGSNVYTACSMSMDGKYRWVLRYYIPDTQISASTPIIFYSIDYGASYTALPNAIIPRNPAAPFGNPFGVCVSQTGKYVSIALLYGSIYYSSDFGTTFILSRTQASTGNCRMMMSASGRYCTIGYYAQIGTPSNCIYYNDQYGRPDAWITVATPTSTYNASGCNNSGQIQALASNVIYLSYDYGKTWALSSAPQYPILNADYRDIHMSGSGQYMVATSTGRPVIYSADYGRTWANLINITPTNPVWLSCMMSSSGEYITITSSDYSSYSNIRTLFINQRTTAILTSGTITSGLINGVDISTLNTQTTTNTSNIASLTTNKLSLIGTTSNLNMSDKNIINVNLLEIGSGGIPPISISKANNGIIMCPLGTISGNVLEAYTDIQFNGESIITKDPLYDVWVSANGNASFSGSFGRPFQTIQQAVNYCETFTDGKNRTINLYSGQYTENITISKSRIAIVGANPTANRSNTISEIIGTITINLTSGNADMNNNNICLSNIQLNAALYDITTFNSPHRVVIKNCFLVSTDNALTMDVNSSVDYRLFIDSSTIQSSLTTSTQPLIRCNGSGMISLINSQFIQTGIENVLQLNGTVRCDTMALCAYTNTSTSADAKAIVSINTSGTNIYTFGQNSFVYSSATAKSNTTTASAIYLNPPISNGNVCTLIILNNFVSLTGLPSGSDAFHTIATTGYYYILHAGNYSSSSLLGTSAHNIAGSNNTNKFSMTAVS